MSELIVRMEMPKNCTECRFEDAVVDLHCGLADRNVKPEGLMMRPSWCPIIGELPEQHGDLIDRGKLLKDIEMYHVSDGRFQHWVELQDAVIAAERKDDE